MSTYRHILRGTTPGEEWSFSIHTRNEAGTNPGAHAAWNAAVTELWQGSTPPNTGGIINRCPSIVVGTQTITYTISDIDGKAVIAARTNVNLVGTCSANMLPYSTAAILRMKGSGSTKHDRGRCYMPPMCTSPNLNGRISPTGQANILNAATAAFRSLNSAGYQVVLFDRKSLAFTPVTTIEVPDVWGRVIRRRNKLIAVVSSATL